MFVVNAKLQDYLTKQFQQITSNVNSLTPKLLLRSTAGRKTLADIVALSQGAHELLDKERKAVHARDEDSKALKYQLARFYNTSTSLLDVVIAGDATDEDVLGYKVEMSELIAGFIDKVKTLEESNLQKERRLVERVEIIATPGDDDSDIRAKERAAERQKEQDDQDKAALNKYDRYKTKMPVKDANQMGDKKLVMFDMPVIPLVPTMLTETILKSIGLDGENVGMYTVIKNQRILAINPKALKAEKQTVEEFVKQVLHNLSERKGSTWNWVTESPATYRASGLQFIWIMEGRKLSRLLKLVHGGIDEWGFPFSVDWKPKPKVNVPQKWSEHNDDGKWNTMRDGTHQNPRKGYPSNP